MFKSQRKGRPPLLFPFFRLFSSPFKFQPRPVLPSRLERCPCGQLHAEVEKDRLFIRPVPPFFFLPCGRFFRFFFLGSSCFSSTQSVTRMFLLFLVKKTFGFFPFPPPPAFRASSFPEAVPGILVRCGPPFYNLRSSSATPEMDPKPLHVPPFFPLSLRHSPSRRPGL